MVHTICVCELQNEDIAYTICACELQKEGIVNTQSISVCELQE